MTAIGPKPWRAELPAHRGPGRLSVTAESTLVALSDRLDVKGAGACTVAVLSAASGWGERAVQMHLARAEEMGLLVRLSGGDGRGRPVRWQLHRPDRQEQGDADMHPSVREQGDTTVHPSDQGYRDTTVHPSGPQRVQGGGTLPDPLKGARCMHPLMKSPSGSEDGALERAATHDSTTAQPRPTATSKSGSERERQPGPRSTPDPLAADVALAVEEPPARRSTPDPLEVSGPDEADDVDVLAPIRAPVACDPTTAPAVRRYGDGFRKAQAAVVHLPRGARRPSRLQATGTCTTCKMPMIELDDDETTHPGCDPVGVAGRLDVLRQSSQA